MCKLLLLIMLFSNCVYAGERHIEGRVATGEDLAKIVSVAVNLLTDASKNKDYQSIKQMLEEYSRYIEKVEELEKNNSIYDKLPIENYKSVFASFYAEITNEFGKKVYRANEIFGHYSRNRIAADKEMRKKSMEVLVIPDTFIESFPEIETLDNGYYALVIRNPLQRSMAVLCIFSPKKSEELIDYDPRNSFISVQGTCRGLVDSRYIVLDDCSVVRYFP